MSSDIIRIAKTLRKRATDAENLLWRHLRSKQFGGHKFRRQQPIGSYIVDFVCFERRIVIEVDGGGHAFEKVKDNERDQWLRGEGFKVLRFWNNDVLQNIDGVLEAIRGHIISPSPVSPLPRVEGKDASKVILLGNPSQRTGTHESRHALA